MDIYDKQAFGSDIEHTVNQFNDAKTLLDDSLEMINLYQQFGKVPDACVIKNGSDQASIASIDGAIKVMDCPKSQLETLVSLHLNRPVIEYDEVPQGTFISLTRQREHLTPASYYEHPGFKVTVLCKGPMQALVDMNSFKFFSYENGVFVINNMGSTMSADIQIGEITDWNMGKIWRVHIQHHFEQMEDYLKKVRLPLDAIMEDLAK